MTDPRTRIRAWWKEQLATGQPIDLDAAAEEATALLIADPDFLSALADSIVRPLVRDIGQRTVSKGTGIARPVQLGSRVMSREQAVAMVDHQLATQAPHWSQLIRREGEGAWFMTLSRDELMIEAKRRREDGESRLKESAFLWGVASTLGSNQVVSDVWSEQELDAYFGVIKIEFRATKTPQLSGSAATPSDMSSTQGAKAA